MPKDCIFCKIVKGEVPCHKLWEDKNHLAFLSISGNTEGFSIVIPKKHYPSYVFDAEDKVISDLMIATKKVAKLIDKNMKDVGRCGVIFEGFGIDHLHSKIFPMHGTKNMSKWKPIESKTNKSFKKYEGYISSHDLNEKIPNEKLAKIARNIRGEKN